MERSRANKKQATGTRAHSRLESKTIATEIAISTVSVSGFSLFKRGRAVCSWWRTAFCCLFIVTFGWQGQRFSYWLKCLPKATIFQREIDLVEQQFRQRSKWQLLSGCWRQESPVEKFPIALTSQCQVWGGAFIALQELFQTSTGNL